MIQGYDMIVFLSAVILTLMIHHSIYNYFPRCHNTFSLQLKFGFLLLSYIKCQVEQWCSELALALCTSSVITFENNVSFNHFRRLLPDRWSSFKIILLHLISYIPAAYLSAKYYGSKSLCKRRNSRLKP